MAHGKDSDLASSPVPAPDTSLSPIDVGSGPPETYHTSVTDISEIPSTGAESPMDAPSSEEDTVSRSHLADELAPCLASFLSPNLLAWTSSDFRKAQTSIAEELEQEKHRLREAGDDRETSDVEDRISAIDVELRAWDETRRASADIEPCWEDFPERQRAYEARIGSLEAGVEGLKAGGGPEEIPRPINTIRTKELEKKWLERSSCPSTTEEWKQNVRAILSDVATSEAELETAHQDVSQYRADLDHEKVQLLAYKARVEGDVASVATTANELLTMIQNVRYNLQKQKDNRDRGAKETGRRMSPLDALIAAERVFKPTHEFAKRIVVKLKTARESIAGLWEEGETRGDGVRSPWELVRAIKARDDKIAGLKDEAREFRETVGHFVRQMEQAQEAAAQSTAENQAAEVANVLVDQVAALASVLFPSDNEKDNGSSNHLALENETEIISDDEYGNVIRMANKFNRVKSSLQGQVKHFQQLAAVYKASRDQALNSAEESSSTCQLLQDEIESIRAECLPRIEEAVRNYEARHGREIEECRAEIHDVNEELSRLNEELREKTTECEDLADKVVDEKKRLLAYKMDRSTGEDAMNPVVQKLIEQTDKEQRALKDKIVELNDTLATLEAQNTTLEKTLQSERERLSRHRDIINSIPALKRNLDDTKQVAEEYRQDLKEAKSHIDTLQHELRREKNSAFDFECGEVEARRLLATLRSDLEDQREESERKMAGIRKKLEIEVARQSAKVAESRMEYRELLERYEGHPNEIMEIMESKGSAIVPTLLLKSALSQRAILLVQLRALREKHASMLADNNYAVRDAKGSKDELAQSKETEARLREEHATALMELQSMQEKLDRATAELQALKFRVEKQEERQKDPAKVWDDTPIGMSKEVLHSRIEMLEENLAKSLRLGVPSGPPTDDTEGHDDPRPKSSTELFGAVRKIDSTWSPSSGPPESSLTAADLSSFWHQGSLLNKKLALLRAIRDGDLERGYDAMDGLDKFLRETDLGPATDEAWGSVQYLQAYFYLYTAGDVVAAQAAGRRAADHSPKRWSRKFYRDMGARLEADLRSERTARRVSGSSSGSVK